MNMAGGENLADYRSIWYYYQGRYRVYEKDVQFLPAVLL